MRHLVFSAIIAASASIGLFSQVGPADALRLDKDEPTCFPDWDDCWYPLHRGAAGFVEDEPEYLTEKQMEMIEELIEQNKKMIETLKKGEVQEVN